MFSESSLAGKIKHRGFVLVMKLSQNEEAGKRHQLLVNTTTTVAKLNSGGTFRYQWEEKKIICAV